MGIYSLTLANKERWNKYGDGLPDTYENANGLDLLDDTDEVQDDEVNAGRNPIINKAAIIQIINTMMLED